MAFSGNLDYRQLRALARDRLDTDIAAGGERRASAEFFEAFYRDHVTAREALGDLCEDCGQPWPCPSFRYIFPPD